MLELNLLDEAKNIERFANTMQDCKYVQVPKVYHGTPNVLIMQRMYGTPIDHVEQLRAQNINIEQVVLQGVEALMLQVFRNGFFHADQHPGNLWIQTDGSRVYLDFGIVGEISETDRKILLSILFHLYSKNYQKVTATVTSAGWINNIDDNELFEKDLSDVGNLFVGKKQKDFSVGAALNHLIKTFEKYSVNIPYQFTLLCKTIVQIEGTSKTLAPELDLQKITVPLLLKHFVKKN
jgi:ubiquinone biosynthesis protein